MLSYSCTNALRCCLPDLRLILGRAAAAADGPGCSGGQDVGGQVGQVTWWARQRCWCGDAGVVQGRQGIGLEAGMCAEVHVGFAGVKRRGGGLCVLARVSWGAWGVGGRGENLDVPVSIWRVAEHGVCWEECSDVRLGVRATATGAGTPGGAQRGTDIVKSVRYIYYCNSTTLLGPHICARIAIASLGVPMAVTNHVCTSACRPKNVRHDMNETLGRFAPSTMQCALPCLARTPGPQGGPQFDSTQTYSRFSPA